MRDIAHFQREKLVDLLEVAVGLEAELVCVDVEVVLEGEATDGRWLTMNRPMPTTTPLQHQPSK